MIRVTGFLLGVCLTVALFLSVLGPDERLRSGRVVESTTAGPPPEHPGAFTTDAEQWNANLVSAANRPEVEEPPDTEPEAVGNESAQLAAGLEARRTPLPVEHSMAVSAEAVAEDVMEDMRYLFWSPFRSEWAAQGFAGQLSLATDVPVEVVNEGPGKYRVGFSYQDETQRQALVSRIETITGLELE